MQLYPVLAVNHLLIPPPLPPGHRRFLFPCIASCIACLYLQLSSRFAVLSLRGRSGRHEGKRRSCEGDSRLDEQASDEQGEPTIERANQNRPSARTSASTCARIHSSGRQCLFTGFLRAAPGRAHAISRKIVCEWDLRGGVWYRERGVARRRGWSRQRWADLAALLGAGLREGRVREEATKVSGVFECDPPSSRHSLRS